MAQGAIKKTPKSNPGKASSNKGGVSKAKQQPKRTKSSAASADKMQKKFSTGLVAKTEKLLAERAGHLELLGRTSKGKGAKGADGKKQKGGSRKFG